jgi:hypothetical protein
MTVAFFSHGVVGKISLNFKGNHKVIDLDANTLVKINKKAFAIHGRLYSYACRTGVSVDDMLLGFKTEADAKPKGSLAQKMANHFGIEVHAFLRRTYYGDVLREKSKSGAISATLKKERGTKDGQLIDIPPDHEALPHVGLANGWPWSGPKKEGTDNYALWRKNGGIKLPTAADSPAGLPTEMRVFRPSHE